MNRSLRRLVAVALAVGVTFAIAAQSRTPYAAEPNGAAALRLSWRIPGEYVEACRTLGEEELARLAPHMRRDVVCEGAMLPYRLTLRVDGAVALQRVVHAAGARGDRPLAVLDELRLAPGEYLVELDWRPMGDGGTARELRATVPLAEREVALITYDATAGAFGVRRGAERGPRTPSGAP